MSNKAEIYSLFKLAQLKAFEGKEMPSWLKNHRAFKNKERIEKVFKAFGLKNFREQVNYTASSENVRQREIQIVDILLSQMSGYINELGNKLRKYAELLDTRNAGSNNQEIINSISEFDKLSGWVKNLHDYFMEAVYYERDLDNKPKLVFTMSFDFEGKRIIHKGQSVFQCFGKINNFIEKQFVKNKLDLNLLPQLTLPEIDKLGAAKSFHSLARAGNNYEVVFSAEGDEGAWDICTMSMRGIQTCQTWDANSDKNEYSGGVIGSILSKYIGIIYLTNNSQMEHGSRMIARCLVAFSVNYSDRHSNIIIGPMYPIHNQEIYTLFEQSIKKHTSIPVINSINADVEKNPMFVPAEGEINELSSSEKPYVYQEIPVNQRISNPIARKYKQEKTQDPFASWWELRRNVADKIFQNLEELSGVGGSATSKIESFIDIKIGNSVEMLRNKVQNYSPKLKFMYIRHKLKKIIYDMKSINIETKLELNLGNTNIAASKFQEIYLLILEYYEQAVNQIYGD